MIIDFIRWVVALPIAATAAFAAHMFFGFTFGLAHGFERVTELWLSHAMADMYISGTYIIVVTRSITAAILVGISSFIVPYYQKQIGIAIAIFVSFSFVLALSFNIYQSITIGLELGVGVWYRNVLEALSIIVGCIIGAGIANNIATKHERA